MFLRDGRIYEVDPKTGGSALQCSFHHPSTGEERPIIGVRINNGTITGFTFAPSPYPLPPGERVNLLR